MTEKRNGTVVRDITTTVTETGQMYVVIPVPASVKAAIKPTNQPPNWTLTPNRHRRRRRRQRVVTPRRGRWEAGLDRSLGGRLQPHLR